MTSILSRSAASAGELGSPMYIISQIVYSQYFVHCWPLLCTLLASLYIVLCTLLITRMTVLIPLLTARTKSGVKGERGERWGGGRGALELLLLAIGIQRWACRHTHQGFWASGAYTPFQGLWAPEALGTRL